MFDFGHGLRVGQGGNGFGWCCIGHGCHFCHVSMAQVFTHALLLRVDLDQLKGGLCGLSAHARLIIVGTPISAREPFWFGLAGCEGVVNLNLIKSSAPRHGI